MIKFRLANKDYTARYDAIRNLTVVSDVESENNTPEITINENEEILIQCTYLKIKPEAHYLVTFLENTNFNKLCREEFENAKCILELNMEARRSRSNRKPLAAFA